MRKYAVRFLVHAVGGTVGVLIGSLICKAALALAPVVAARPHQLMFAILPVLLAALAFLLWWSVKLKEQG